MTPIARVMFVTTIWLVAFGILVTLILRYAVSAEISTVIWYITIMMGILLSFVALVTWLVESLAKKPGNPSGERPGDENEARAG